MHLCFKNRAFFYLRVKMSDAGQPKVELFVKVNDVFYYYYLFILKTYAKTLRSFKGKHSLNAEKYSTLRSLITCVFVR